MTLLNFPLLPIAINLIREVSPAIDPLSIESKRIKELQTETEERQDNLDVLSEAFQPYRFILTPSMQFASFNMKKLVHSSSYIFERSLQFNGSTEGLLVNMRLTNAREQSLRQTPVIDVTQSGCIPLSYGDRNSRHHFYDPNT
jgi:hypothetical protein